MLSDSNIIQRIKSSVHVTAPGATVILYGSYARGDNRADSDIDILVLIDKDQITTEDKKKIKYPLYHIGYDTTVIISPLIFPRKVWENKYSITPFYENVLKEGIVL